MTCLGPRKDQCMSCCDSGACGADYDREPNFGTCTCASGLVESDDMCLSSCNGVLKGKYMNQCLSDCPSDSLKYFDWSVSGTSPGFSDYDASSTTH